MERTMRYADPGPAARADMAASRKWQEEWREELRGRGLPTFREAIAAGMEPGAWLKMLDEAGV